MIGEGHVDEVGERAAEFGAAQRLHSAGRAWRKGAAAIGEAATAIVAAPARKLEGHHHPLAGVEAGFIAASTTTPTAS